MSIKSLTTDKQGNVVIPESPADWDQWVSASRTRNYVLEDPLIDWLDLYGEAKGYTRDISDERTDFNAFTMNQGIRFEEYVVAHFKGVAEVETIWEGDYASRYDLSTSEDTFHAMERGVQIIYQGTLRDAESKTYGSPDFLIRSDIVNELFPGTINVEESFTRAPDIAESNWHYVVVDSKFATLNLFSRTPGLRNTEKTRAYKVQVMLYNRMLGRLQGYTPSMAFLLGRGWNRKVDGEDIGSSSAMSKLGPVLCDPEDKEGREVLDLANNAVDWVRSVRSEGHEWVAEPEPSVPGLRVRANGEHGLWSGACKKVLEVTEDLTVLYRVSATARDIANKSGFTKWTDPLITPPDVGVTGKVYPAQLEAFLQVNRPDGEDLVLPRRIAAERATWHPRPALEFFVDFETVNSLNDKFTKFPFQNAQSLIFMIGCGHIEDGEWQFSCFVTDRLTETHEAQIIDDWFDHMVSVQARLDPGSTANIFHWSDAEKNFLQKGDTSAFERHDGHNWPIPNWFDFWKLVMKPEPVVVRGAHGFGLKPITKALNNLGLINIEWPDGTTDGLGAMTGAWWCDEEAERDGKVLKDYELMGDIEAYNEIDCKAMFEIINYLRLKH